MDGLHSTKLHVIQNADSPLKGLFSEEISFVKISNEFLLLGVAISFCHLNLETDLI
jgi:hypothetical protein